MASSVVLLLSPIPPPMHGGAYATSLLLHSRFREAFRVIHIDAKFVERIDELQKFTLRKIGLLLRYLWQLMSQSLLHRVDIVILTPAFYPKPFLKDSLFIFTAKLLQRKVVAWFHMDFAAMKFEEQSRWMQRYIAFTLSLCDYYVCVGAPLADKYPSFMERQKVVIIPNGIPAGTPSTKETSGTVHVLYLSNMAIAKGWKVLFEAAQSVCCHREDVIFSFYGSPTADTSLEDIEKTFSTSAYPDRIRFCGYVEGGRKEEAFRQADVFCFPSMNEAFPLTILEAMSYGLPVVASDVGAIREAVHESQGGVLVPPGNSQALATALLQVLDHPRERDRMGAYNRALYEREFTATAFAERWVAFIGRIMAGEAASCA